MSIIQGNKNSEICCYILSSVSDIKNVTMLDIANFKIIHEFEDESLFLVFIN